MKKTLLILSIVLGSFIHSNAQSLLLTPNDSAEVTATQADEFEPTDVHIEIINNTSASQRITWRMLNYVAPSAWELKLCDNNNCYDLLIGNPIHVSLPVAAGDSMDMKFQFTAHCIAGAGSANVVAYLADDSANTAVVLNYKANLSVTCVNGLNDTQIPTLSVFPNPTSKTLTTSLPEMCNRVSVVNLLGEQVLLQECSPLLNTSTIDIQQLSIGSYHIVYYSKQNNVIGRSRFIVSK